jgi:predicted NodU family carbamoyl transferase
MLGNTSFNRAGEPLIHTIDDAIKALESDDFIEYLYLPEEGKLLFSPNA